MLLLLGGLVRFAAAESMVGFNAPGARQVPAADLPLAWDLRRGTCVRWQLELPLLREVAQQYPLSPAAVRLRNLVEALDAAPATADGD